MEEEDGEGDVGGWMIVAYGIRGKVGVYLF